MTKLEVSASLMCSDLLNLKDDILALEKSGVDYMHIDIMDGNYVENFAMSPYEMKQIKTVTDIPLDVHLMIKEPLRYIDYFVESGADLLTVHYESATHINSVLQKIKENGIKSGIALNPGTSHRLIEPLLEYVDMVLIMSVNPGFAGQDFIPYTVEKVRQTREMLDELGYSHIPIQVDGNINTKTIPPLYKAGANIFVAGSSGLFFGDMDYKKNLEELRNCVE